MAATKNEKPDPTFGKYTNEQARQYTIGRGASYPPQLYTTILRYHEETGGQTHKLLDLGCGPGRATHDLAPFFDTAIGADYSKEMINVARSQKYMAKSSPVQFEVASDKDFDKIPGLEEGSVDLLTAATAVCMTGLLCGHANVARGSLV